MRRTCWITLFLLLTGTASMTLALHDTTKSPDASVNMGCILSERTSIHTNNEWKALGPFIEAIRDPMGRTFSALRPFFSKSVDPNQQHERRDYLWPLASTGNYENRSTWRALLVYGRNWNTETDSRYRWMLFPLVAHGRDRKGDQFFALMPFGGEVREMFWRDTIRFVLFPLYMSTQVNEQVSRSVLWPIIAWTHGDGTKRFRVFPFYGYSKEKDKWTRRFVLWPFWSSVRYDYPEEQGKGFVLFPLFGKVNTNRQKSYMVIPPFFRSTKGEDHREIMAPWPFVQYKHTPDAKKLYLWPLWGHHATGSLDSSFVLWPFIRMQELRRSAAALRSFYLFPFITHQSEHVPDASTPDTSVSHVIDETPSPQPDSTQKTTVRKRYLKLWPLMSYQREDDISRLRVLELWPFRRMRGIEQNWSAFWTLYERERVGSEVETELLWGLYRRQKTKKGSHNTSLFPLFDHMVCPDKETKKWSLFKGLLRKEQQGLHRRWTVLYFLKFGQLPPAPGSAAVTDGASE